MMTSNNYVYAVEQKLTCKETPTEDQEHHKEDTLASKDQNIVEKIGKELIKHVRLNESW